MTHRVPYLTSDLEQLKKRLPGILTCTEDVAAELAKKQYPEEVRPLADILAQAPDRLHHKWASAILAQVPLSAWGRRTGGEAQIEPSKKASLRFLACGPLPDNATDELKQLAFRQTFFELLLERMPAALQRIYRPMIQWVAHDELGDPGLTRHPLSSDTGFGHNLVVFESMMDMQIHAYERQWAESVNWSSEKSIPAHVTRECSQAALNHLSKIVEKWFAEDADEAENTPDSLLALVSANLSANRILLEFAGLESRGFEAANMAIELLEGLNRQGITEVPIEIEGLSLDEGVEKLKEIFTRWFGHGGAMLGVDPFFRRPMNASDIDLVASWSLQLQESFIGIRGRRGGQEAAKAIHGTSNHLFIFGIAIVGAFYSSTKTDHEFTGNSNPSYSVFPGRKLISSGEREAPPTHANHLLMQAYGQIYFANSGWDLYADRIPIYFESASIKRAHIQQLLHYAIKDRAPSQLLMLNKRLQRLIDSERAARSSHPGTGDTP
ncbi:hypothetical protein Q1Z72_01850 [Pseudomonas qingdaonensis]|uniref:hypothetical protein n=1 Tax=Pseudomonas qingdaonensis TaxID=2056231 RepID=UPI0021F1F771|nr:hypothetical protein [Pseudomonas qingdaonensis]WKL67439.1 hypothetical protein Q1Z72_01850 [Pseudomonas qingdaonensis]